jgi:putative transposase
MARPLRIEFPGAVYHVTSRGDRREPIFVDDVDRSGLLAVVGQALQRFDAQMLAYCLMGNHYHFVLYTRRANLSLLMRHINGVYTQAFNRRHLKVGHLFQGRFKAILVDRDAYLLEVCRYVELNPVRARMVAAPSDWAWSSYRVHAGSAGRQEAPPWLDVAGLHGYVLGRPAESAADHRRAAQRYAKLVAEAHDVRLWDDALRQQIYLGDEDFVERMQQQAQPALKHAPQASVRDIPAAQRRPPRSLLQWLSKGESRQQAMYNAHTQGGYTMSAIAAQIGLSVSRVSRLVAKYERELEEQKVAKGKA